MDRMLQVRLSPEDYDALKRAAVALNLTNRSALVRALADAVQRKSARELRHFLFLDETDTAGK